MPKQRYYGEKKRKKRRVPTPSPQVTFKRTRSEGCKCCGVQHMDISGCSCLAGSSHECKHEIKTLLTPPRLTELLCIHKLPPELAGIVHGYADNSFISTWTVGTDYVNTDIRQDDLMKLPMYVKIPLKGAGSYDFMVDWGDGRENHITVFNQAEVKHTYATAGDYTITMNGIIDGWTFKSSNCKLNKKLRYQIINISQWGCLGLDKTGGFQFFGCRRCKLTAKDSPNLTGVRSVHGNPRSMARELGLLGSP